VSDGDRTKRANERKKGEKGESEIMRKMMEK